MSYLVIKYDERVIYLKPDFREMIFYNGKKMVIDYYFFRSHVQLFARQTDYTTLAHGPSVKAAKRMLKDRLIYIESLERG